MSDGENRSWKPGDKALILFSDGLRRPAELSPGFIWATADGAHWFAAEGGFDALPLLLDVSLPPEGGAGGVEAVSNCFHINERRPCGTDGCSCFKGHPGDHHDALGRPIRPDRPYCYREEWKP